jgi:hypothetical protein
MSGRPKIANGRLGDVAPFRCGTAPGLCVSTCMLVVGGRHRGQTLCIWHPLGVGGLQPLRSAIGAAQSYRIEALVSIARHTQLRCESHLGKYKIRLDLDKK